MANDSTTIQMRQILLRTHDKISQPISVSCDLLLQSSSCNGQGNNGRIGMYLAESTSSSDHCLIVDSIPFPHYMKPGVHNQINIEISEFNLFNLHIDPSDVISEIVIELLVSNYC